MAIYTNQLGHSDSLVVKGQTKSNKLIDFLPSATNSNSFGLEFNLLAKLMERFMANRKQPQVWAYLKITFIRTPKKDCFLVFNANFTRFLKVQYDRQI